MSETLSSTGGKVCIAYFASKDSDRTVPLDDDAAEVIDHYERFMRSTSKDARFFHKHCYTIFVHGYADGFVGADRFTTLDLIGQSYAKWGGSKTLILVSCYTGWDIGRSAAKQVGGTVVLPFGIAGFATQEQTLFSRAAYLPKEVNHEAVVHQTAREMGIQPPKASRDGWLCIRPKVGSWVAPKFLRSSFLLE